MQLFSAVNGNLNKVEEQLRAVIDTVNSSSGAVDTENSVWGWGKYGRYNMQVT